MHKLVTARVLIPLLVSLASQPIPAKPLTPKDFAFNAQLSEPESNSNASVRQVVLPASVYDKMRRSDYGDLRVFSANGQVVPHQFKFESVVSGTQEIPLTFYPFSKEEAANTANIRVIIDQKAGQQRLDINQHTGEPKPVVRHEYQYVIVNKSEKTNASSSSPTSSSSSTLCKIKLDWEQTKPSLILPFSLESSNNLQNWRSLGHALNVSNLSYSDSKLLRNEVDFTCTNEKYLRLTWRKAQDQVHLKKINGLFTQGGSQTFQWKNLKKPQYDKDGNWLFESNVVALSKMEFVAPQNGLLYKGSLYSRNDDNSPWRFRKNVSQYRLSVGENGEQVVQKSTPFSLRENSDRYWKFQPANEGKLSEDQLPEIKVGWQQRQLIYLAQGNAPFTLSLGNSTVKPVSDSGLMQVIQGLDKSDISLEIVTLGKLVETKDYQEASNMPWKKIGLWALLLLGTAMLGYMALSLMRQMNKDEKG